MRQNERGAREMGVHSHKGFVKGNRKVIQNSLMFDYRAHSEMVDLG